jgi:hypothetical protein
MLGFRSRQYKQVQFNQAFNQAVSSERRLFIPAPMGGENKSLPRHLLPPIYAESSNFIPTEKGLIVPRDAKGRATLPGWGDSWSTLIPFAASSSADAKLFGHATAIYDLTPHIDSTSASVSAGLLVSACASVPFNRYGWTEFNKSLILVGAPSASAVRYTTALDKFIPWSATASGDSIHNMWGINSFKNRIYAWPKDEPKFFYGSTDAVLGTLEPFSLGTVAPGSQNVSTFFGMTRDGGSGPDDFATFIMNDGKVVVYQGSDPGDANNWSLVGTYQIGKPFGRRCAVAAGAEHYVLCEDDIYVLPRDLQGKRNPSNFVDSSRTSNTNAAPTEIDGTYNNVTGHILWEDGTVIAHNQHGQPGLDSNYELDAVTVFDGRTFFSRKQNPGVTDDPVLSEFEPVDAFGAALSTAITKDSSLKTAPIPTNSRTNIALYNPIFDHDANTKIIYRSRILYDYSASADWVTATASGNTTGQWFAGFGTGRAPQIEVWILSTSAGGSENIIFRGIDLTLTETGGI